MIRGLIVTLPCVVAVACASTARGVPGSDGCSPGEVRCQGEELQQCDAEGVAFEVKLKCLPGTCIDGQASCPEVTTSSGGASTSGSSGGDSGSAGGGTTNPGGAA